MAHHPFSLWQTGSSFILESFLPSVYASTAGFSFTSNCIDTINIHELLYAKLQGNYGLGWLPRLQGQNLIWKIIAVSSNDPNLTGHANSSPSQAKSMWTALHRSVRALDCVLHCLPKTLTQEGYTSLIIVIWKGVHIQGKQAYKSEVLSEGGLGKNTFCFSAIISENIYHENAKMQELCMLYYILKDC